FCCEIFRIQKKSSIVNSLVNSIINGSKHSISLVPPKRICNSIFYLIKFQ
ncbi:unnamed protein product, partial [Brassica rapa]